MPEWFIILKYISWSIVGLFVILSIFGIYLVIKSADPSILNQTSNLSIKGPVSGPKPGSKGEAECKRVVEEIFHRPFQSSFRPDWLKNPATGRNLEIDIWNAELNLGIEYDGQQHFKPINGMGQSNSDFVYQVIKDKLKDDICKKRGVHLLRVPYTVRKNDIENYLTKKLKKINLI